ncbi:MAG: hypothetical protein DRQ35_01220 [Gammaproteobacteria bacterium]|nr:MAG: hypothetical protein DRQ35_01220 [Gammaproteobacteria bacterium]
MKNITLILSVGFFTACSDNDFDGDSQDNLAPAKTYVYECDQQFSFTARIEGEKVWLFLPSETINLPHIPAASGTKFSDGDSLFWTKGNEAMLEVNSVSYRTCKNNHSKAIWEHAKLNGVDFRALGNEPGWVLTIAEGNKVTFKSNYGQTINKFIISPPVTNQNTHTTLYQASNKNHTILIILEGTDCSDTMSGEAFETTVTVVLDDKEFNGCGKALH